MSRIRYLEIQSWAVAIKIAFYKMWWVIINKKMIHLVSLVNIIVVWSISFKKNLYLKTGFMNEQDSNNTILLWDITSSDVGFDLTSSRLSVHSLANLKNVEIVTYYRRFGQQWFRIWSKFIYLFIYFTVYIAANLYSSN